MSECYYENVMCKKTSGLYYDFCFFCPFRYNLEILFLPYSLLGCCISVGIIGSLCFHSFLCTFLLFPDDFSFLYFFLIYAEFVCKKCLGYSRVPLSEVLSVKSVEYNSDFNVSCIHFTERLIKFKERKWFCMFFLTLLPSWDTIHVQLCSRHGSIALGQIILANISSGLFRDT